MHIDVQAHGCARAWDQASLHLCQRDPEPTKSFFFFGSDLGKLAKPSNQTVLERVLGIRNQSSLPMIVPQPSVVADMTRNPPPLRKHGRGPRSQAKTAVQRPPRA